MRKLLKNAALAAALILIILSGAMADGILLPVERPHPDRIVPNELFAVKYHHVKVDISDQLAITKIDQVFRNESGVEREGMYVFPMPESSAITKFSMFAGEQEIQGKILDKNEARGIYESIVRQRKDPAILEYIGRNTFKARVYPIPANGEKRIKLEYTEVVGKTGGVYRYVYPLSTERFSAKPLEDCRVTIKITSKQPITSVYSPTHDIKSERANDKEAIVRWEVKNAKPDTDMILYYSVSDDDLGIDLIAHREKGENGYYMLLASPRVDIDEAKVQPKNVVFVLDRSGSMAGEKIEQARGALRFCLNVLRAEDTFNVITFNGTSELMFKTMQKTKGDAKKQALDAVENIEASGGTNINEALAEALKQFKGQDSERNYVIFLTDGLPTVGETSIEAILKSAKHSNTTNTRIFAWGVGYDVNTHLLDKLALESKGDADYVRPSEDIEVKVSGFFAKVSEPLLSDVEISISGVKTSDGFPSKNFPDIFKGSQLIAFGRYDGSGKVEVKLSGVAGGKKRTFTLNTNLPLVEESNSFIPQLWAARKIGYLLDEIRLHSNQELIDEVVRLSKKYGIPTEYTSFLADDRKYAFDLNNSVVLASERIKKESAQTVGASAVSQSSNNYAMRNQSRLPSADAYSQANAGAPVAVKGNLAANARLGASYRDSNDQLVVMANVQNISRRTFYQRGDFWEDADAKPEQKFTQVKQFSNAHFELMRRHPQLTQFSTLGNVRVLLENNQAVEIGPDGKEQLSDDELDELLKGIPGEVRVSMAGMGSALPAAGIILVLIGLGIPVTKRFRLPL